MVLCWVLSGIIGVGEVIGVSGRVDAGDWFPPLGFTCFMVFWLLGLRV